MIRQPLALHARQEAFGALGEKNKPWKFKHLTVDHVYEPLARSNGKILALTQASRLASKDRWKRLHQFLSEIGVKALRTHLGQILGIAQVSDTKEENEARIRRVFGSPDRSDPQLPIPFPE